MGQTGKKQVKPGKRERLAGVVEEKLGRLMGRFGKVKF